MSITKVYAAHSPTTPLAPFEIERRAVGPNDVLIDILFCGVCHSDIHQVRGEWGNSIYPMVPGHEIVGTVISTGHLVKKYKIGDTVGVGCMCGSCQKCEQCNLDQEQFCEKGATMTYNSMDKQTNQITYGGYSKQIVVDESFVLRIPKNLDLAGAAPLLCAGITTYSPLRYVNVKKGDKVAVLGLGGLGHMAVKFAVAFGAEVTMLSTSPNKLADAKKLGAHHFQLITDAQQMKALKSNFNYILNTVSVAHNYSQMLGLLKPNGVMLMVGLPIENINFSPFSLVSGNRSIKGSSIGGIAETQEMLDFCGEHNIVSDIEIIDINYIETAYARMLKNDIRYRFVIDLASLV